MPWEYFWSKRYLLFQEDLFHTIDHKQKYISSLTEKETSRKINLALLFFSAYLAHF